MFRGGGNGGLLQGHPGGPLRLSNQFSLIFFLKTGLRFCYRLCFMSAWVRQDMSKTSSHFLVHSQTEKLLQKKKVNLEEKVSVSIFLFSRKNSEKLCEDGFKQHHILWRKSLFGSDSPQTFGFRSVGNSDCSWLPTHKLPWKPGWFSYLLHDSCTCIHIQYVYRYIYKSRRPQKAS